MANTPSASAPERPPAAFASSDSGTVELGLGSWCWGVACADALAIITKSDSLTALRGEQIRIYTQADSAKIREVQVLDGYPRSTPQEVRPDGLIAWADQQDQAAQLPFTLNDGTISFSADLEPGQYVVGVFVGFSPMGTADYGLLLDVQ